MSASVAVLPGLAGLGAAWLVLGLLGWAMPGMRVRGIALALGGAGLATVVSFLALGAPAGHWVLAFGVAGVRPVLALDGVSGFFLVALLPVGVAALVLSAGPRRLVLLGGAVLAMLAGNGGGLVLTVAVAGLAGLGGGRGGWGVALVVAALALALPGGESGFAALRERVAGEGADMAMPLLGFVAGGVLAAGAVRGRGGLDAVLLATLGLYVLTRICLDLAGPLAAGWAVAPVAAGAVGAVLGARAAAGAPAWGGVLAGLGVARSGLAAMALGVAVAARAVDDGPVAALALAAALVLMAGLGWALALGALVGAALERGAGSGALGRLGGVAQRMRFSFAGALMAGLALALLPPGAGFAGVWLLLRAAATLPRGGGAEWWALGLAVVLAAGLAVGLVGFAVLRAVGMAFLGRPRSPRAAAAEEVGPGRRWAMLAFCTVLAVVGLLPGVVVALAVPAITALAGAAVSGSWLGVSGYAPLGLGLLLALALTAVAALVRARAPAGYRVAPAWEGGQPPPPDWLPFGDPATQLGPAGFARALPTCPRLGWRLRLPVLDVRVLLVLPRRAGPVLVGAVATALLLLRGVGGVVSVVLPLVAQVLHLALVLAAAPVLAGFVAWCQARMQGRAAPSVLQPWRNMARALGQMPVVAEGASPLWRAAPGAQVAVLAVAAALVPSFTAHMALASLADLVAIAGLLALAQALAVLAALDEGSAASGHAAASTLARGALAMPALLGVIFAFALAAGGTGLPAVLGVPFDEAPGLLAALLPLGLALGLVAATDGGDGPGALSGRHLALHEAAGALRRLVWLGLVAVLVLPPGLPPARADAAATVGDWLLFLPLWGAKMAVLAAGIALVRCVVPKPREGMAMLVVATLLAVLGVGVLFAGQALRGAA